MGIAPYQRRYLRGRIEDVADPVRPRRNPARRFTDQGADPDPIDLGWRIRRRWRVLYYGARHAAKLPLWQGAADFEVVMADVLWRLSSGFRPIPPLACREEDAASEGLADIRRGRTYHCSCRVFPTPVIEPPEWDD